MKQTPKPIGRPRFRIEGTRLRALRDEAGLSLQALAQLVYDRAGKPQASPEVLKNTAQRWESTGAIPANMAQHVADVLHTTVAILQGTLPSPAPSKLDEIEGRLRELIATAPPPRLLEALALLEGAENPARALAMHVSSRLEVAQLSQAQDEFQDLAAITGYCIRELQEPTSFQGFWMLVRLGPLRPATAEILSGVGDVQFVVRTELKSFLEHLHPSDAHVVFVEEKHWFKVTIQDPRHARLSQTLRFVRCQPTESGLKWSSPTWQDRYWLETLPNDAREYANFVTGFDSVCVPADCRKLRFVVARTPTLEEFEEHGPDAFPEIVASTAGDIESLPPETFEAFRREGSSHDLVLSWLAADLWETLLPLMAEWPLECWSFRAAHARVDVLLDVPYRLYANSKAPLHLGNRFSLMLVEVGADGGQRTAP